MAVTAHEENGTVDAVSLACQKEHCCVMDGCLVHPNESSAGDSTAISTSTFVFELASLHANTGKLGQFTVLVEMCRSSAALRVNKKLDEFCMPYAETTTHYGM